MKILQLRAQIATTYLFVKWGISGYSTDLNCGKPDRNMERVRLLFGGFSLK